MSLEIELQNRLLGITPSHEQQLQYVAIFRVSPELAFSTAYVDGYHKASCMYAQIIEQLVARIIEENKHEV